VHVPRRYRILALVGIFPRGLLSIPELSEHRKKGHHEVLVHRERIRYGNCSQMVAGIKQERSRSIRPQIERADVLDPRENVGKKLARTSG